MPTYFSQFSVKHDDGGNVRGRTGKPQLVRELIDERARGSGTGEGRFSGNVARFFSQY